MHRIEALALRLAVARWFESRALSNALMAHETRCVARAERLFNNAVLAWQVSEVDAQAALRNANNRLGL